MNFTGTKYQRDLDVKEIAKLVRADIKEAIRKKRLPKGTKVSVRISRYSGGRSVDAYIKHLGGERVINPAWVKWHDENPNGYFGDAPPRYTATATHALKTVAALIAAYNFDDSDHQTDYFCVNFHSNTEFDYDFRQADEALIRREDLYADESEEAVEEAVTKGSAITCTGDDNCSACQVLKATQPKPKPLVSYPVFNQREPYRC